MSKAFYVLLKNRGLIHIEGEDRIPFLQGLVTNDVTKLEKSRILYACLLTPQGKFLHDFFMHWGDGFILLDCESGFRAEDLYNRLNNHRLRSKVKISFEKDVPVYAVYDDEIGLPDPRHFKLGNRSFEKPDLTREDFDEWDQQRIILGVPDGSRDMEIDRSLPLECNIDKFHGMNWEKGCYMGQELSARMHHRNLGKKHLRPLKFSGMPTPLPFTDIHLNGKMIGNMRSSCGDIGLAIIRDEYLEELKNDKNSVRLLG
jgi:tRNA-modifying protein YgfZ